MYFQITIKVTKFWMHKSAESIHRYRYQSGMAEVPRICTYVGNRKNAIPSGRRLIQSKRDCESERTLLILQITRLIFRFQTAAPGSSRAGPAISRRWITKLKGFLAIPRPTRILARSPRRPTMKTAKCLWRIVPRSSSVGSACCSFVHH